MSEYDVQLRVQAEIAKLYGSSARKMLTNSNTQMHAMAGPEMPTSFTDWSLDAKALASALPPSFVVRFSLTRDFSSDDAADVGSWVKLMPASHHVDIEKRTSTIDTTYQGSVSLTASLLDEVTAGRLRSLEPEDVVPYLKEKLSWTVISVRISPLYYLVLMPC
jgi:tyrosinase